MNGRTEQKGPATDAEAFPDWMVEDLDRNGLEVAAARLLGFRPRTVERLAAEVGRDLPPETRAYAIPCMDPIGGRPLCDARGKPVEIFRVLRSSNVDGSPASRYLPRTDSGRHAYIPADAHAAFAAGGALHLTDDVLGALCATTNGLPCMAVSGPRGWKQPGARALLPELLPYATRGRLWVFLWSSGSALDPEYVRAGECVAHLLLAAGCRVRFWHVPADSGNPTADIGLGEHIAGPVARPPDPEDLRGCPVPTPEMLGQIAALRADIADIRRSVAGDTARDLPAQVEEESLLIQAESGIRLGVLPRMRDLENRLSALARPPPSSPDRAAIDRVLRMIAARSALSTRSERGLMREDVLPLMSGLGLRAPARVLDGYLSDAVQANRLRAAGPVWPDEEGGTEPADHRLLAGIQRVLQGTASDRIGSRELLSLLDGLADRPWTPAESGPLTPRRLAALLEPYGIRPVAAKIGGRTRRAYMLRDLEHAFRQHPGPSTAGLPAADTSGS